MSKLGDLYSDFFRIDLDTRGGYARVAQVKPLGQKGFPTFCAFKVMRHELKSPQKGIDRFEGEAKTLLEITQDKNCPPEITKIYDSGFVSIKLSTSLQKTLEMVENTRKVELINPEIEIISAGTDLKNFRSLRIDLSAKNSNLWLPYIVVELVPYDDNLLRQIRTLLSGNPSDLYRLPVREIISMGLQILDLIDYLHQRHNFCYIDWKPEHIYWNSLIPRLKIIDWNASDRFVSDQNKRILIREDIRMFSGAALYCSLALNDPEDLNLKRPIGFKSNTAPNPLLPTQSRYWTDQPFFYDRDIIIDDRIKSLVRNALDPRKGFDSPQEFKDELLNYGEQVLGLSASDFSPEATAQQKKSEVQTLLEEADEASARSEYYRSTQLYRRALQIDSHNERARKHLEQAESELATADDTGKKLPREAMQLFRTARSYLAGMDHQDAIRTLDDAIEIAFKKGVVFREAQQLRDEIRTSLEIDRTKQKISDSLKSGEWDLALELYRQAISINPENKALLDELSSLHTLIQAESELRSKGSRKFFTRLRKYRVLLNDSRKIFNSDNPILNSLDRKIAGIWFVQLGLAGVIILISILLLPIASQRIGYLFNPASISPTVTPISSSHSVSATETPVLTTQTNIAVSFTPTVTATETPTATPPLAALAAGYITFGQISSWDSPNGKFIEFLHMNQAVTIIEKRNDHGDDWYRCTWERDGVVKEGWILARYIQLGSPPTPKP